MTVAEGGGKRAIAKKMQDVYVPALKANFLVWPAVQMLNFRVIPLQFQIVSSPSGLKSIDIDLLPAARINGWYCLDGISLPHQLR